MQRDSRVIGFLGGNKGLNERYTFLSTEESCYDHDMFSSI
jgi:hypothetical protein